MMEGHFYANHGDRSGDWPRVKRHRNASSQSSTSCSSLEERDRPAYWEATRGPQLFEDSRSRSRKDRPYPLQPDQTARGSQLGVSRSPSYTAFDNNNNKPSLPPLRAILGDRPSSPPAVPNAGSTSLQPSPCEPSYGMSTYKPPSLYPIAAGIDARRDSSFPSACLPAIGAPQVMRSPPRRHLSGSSVASDERHSGFPRPRLPPYDGASQPPVTYRHSQSYSTRRDSVPTSPTYSRSEPRSRQSPTTSISAESTTSATSIGSRQASAYWGGPATYHEMQTRRASFDAREEGRSASTSSYQLPVRASYHPPDSQYSVAQPAAPDPTQLEEQGRIVQGGYGAQTYPYEQSQYYAPGLYEYQNGKSRKRSNLPKQSTEIMKRWFDQNIQNPYPTEEQKRHFAAMAGINLTQVSNWFINHRRRCPELKDRRDKTHGSGRDDMY